MTRADTPSTEGEHDWREPTLRKLALWGARVGVVSWAWMAFQVAFQGGHDLAHGILLVFAMFVIGLAWVARGYFSYRMSVWLLVCLMWAVAIPAALLAMAPGAVLCFLAAPLVAGSYIGARAGLWTAGGSLSGLIGVAVAHVLYPEESPDLHFFDPRDPRNWLRVILTMSLLGSFLVVTVVSLLRNLQSMLLERTEALGALHAAHQALRVEQAEKTRALEAELSAQHSLLTLQKREAVGQLAAGIAHDYNNQLLVILAWSDMLRMQGAVSERTRDQALDAISSAANQSAMLTRRLLVLGQGAVEMGGSCVPDPVIAKEIKALRRLIPADIEIRFAPGGVPAVSMHETELRQILLNLLLNARDAMQSGGLIQVATQSESRNAGERVCITVSDTGAGMDEVTQRRIFEPFFSTKGERGTGLGLSSAQMVVTRAQGEISVRSKPGAGSTFSVRLPRAAEPEAKQALSVRSMAPASPRTVLVVDDDEQVRQVVENVLAQAGYSVLGASGSTRALELLRRHRGAIDMLCVDAVLPAPGARFLIWEYRASHPLGAVLVFSGYPQEALAQRGFSADEHAILAKPFTGTELVQRVTHELAAQHDSCSTRAVS